MGRSSIIAFDQDERAKEEWIDALVSGKAQTSRQVPPADAARPVANLLCLDDVFGLRASTFEESPYFVASDSTARKYPKEAFGSVDQIGWVHYGQYLHFRPSIDALADELLRNLMGLPERASIPPFLTVHLRRGDFGNRARIEQFAVAVDELRTRLDQTPGGRWRGRAHELGVVAATDEEDPAFLAEMRGHGWHVIDHKAYGTIERFGVWLPTSA